MFKITGYLIGTIICLILGVVNIDAHLYFLICFFFSLADILGIIIYRWLSSHFVGFWKIWNKRYQKHLAR